MFETDPIQAETGKRVNEGLELCTNKHCALFVLSTQ